MMVKTLNIRQSNAVSSIVPNIYPLSYEATHVIFDGCSAP
jgi:hypothetical protein